LQFLRVPAKTSDVNLCRIDFADAVTRARAEARIKFVKEIKRLSADDWRGWAWLAERMFPSEFGRSEPRTIIVERPKEEQALTILYSCGDKTFKELTNFPIHESMVVPGYWEKIEREKQRQAEAPEAIAQYDPDSEDEEKISDAPPPTVINKALTGRIPEHWKGKGNGK
jgi:hypothetical protein